MPVINSCKRNSRVRQSTGIVGLVLMLSGCSTLQREPEKQLGPSPLVVASCPERVPLEDDSLGAWVALSFELAQQYDKCRAAALGSE